MAAATKITLTYPIKDGSTEIKEISLRRPKVRDLMVMDEVDGSLEKSVRMIAQLSDLPVSVIEDLDAADFSKAAEVVEAFLA